MLNQPPSEPDWDYVIERVFPRLGMWTGAVTYVRAVAFLKGFDLARGGRLHPLLQSWAEERFGPTNIGWPSLLIYLTIGKPRDDDLWPEGRGEDLTSEQDAAALDLLRRALTDVRSSL